MSRNYAPIGRPTPLRDAARSIGGGLTFAGALASFLATWGILGAGQAGALNALLAAVPGLITLVAGLLASFGIVHKAEAKVTPLSAPQNNRGEELTPAGT